VRLLKDPEVRVKDVARRFGVSVGKCTNRWVPWPRTEVAIFLTQIDFSRF
jgi:hypothetical protein